MLIVIATRTTVVTPAPETRIRGKDILSVCLRVKDYLSCFKDTNKEQRISSLFASVSKIIPAASETRIRGSNIFTVCLCLKNSFGYFRDTNKGQEYHHCLSPVSTRCHHSFPKPGPNLGISQGHSLDGQVLVREGALSRTNNGGNAGEKEGCLRLMIALDGRRW
jgi:hypothetical protein